MMSQEINDPHAIRKGERLRPKVRALIFDMDGTLADSDPLHLVAFQQYLQPFGIAVDDTFYRDRVSGRTNVAIFGDLFPGQPREALERHGDEKEALFRRLAGKLEPIPGLDMLLARAHAHRLAAAVVTNGPRANLEHMLAVLGLTGRFDIAIAREDVVRGKPDPLPYLTALTRLGIAAAEALAFEDSPAGIRAAKAAGLFTFGLTTGQPPAVLAAAGADRIIADFRDAGLKREIDERLTAPGSDTRQADEPSAAPD